MQNRCFARRLIVRSGAERRFPAAATGKSTLFSRIALTFRIKKVIFADMELRVKQVREVTGPLLDAFARLMPQLSPRLAAPSAARLREIAVSPSAALFAAEAGGCVRGLLTLVWYDVPSGRKAWIEDVVVDAEVRGTGAGRALVAAALEHAAGVGAGEVLLTSNPAREAARALYRKMGFEEAATAVFAIKTDAE